VVPGTQAGDLDEVLRAGAPALAGVRVQQGRVVLRRWILQRHRVLLPGQVVVRGLVGPGWRRRPGRRAGRGVGFRSGVGNGIRLHCGGVGGDGQG
jgi:hypothetical protein